MSRSPMFRVLSGVLLLIVCIGLVPIDGAYSQLPSGTVYVPLLYRGAPAVIPDTTQVLSPDTTDYLTAVSADGSRLTFSQMTPELQALAAGDVIVADVSGAAPYGFLRKVSSVTSAGGQVVVQTTDATLEEAIDTGEVIETQELKPGDIQESALAEGVSLASGPQAQLNVFSYQIDNLVLFDVDGDHDTKHDQITANGGVSLSVSFDFSLIIKRFRLNHFHITGTATEDANLTIHSVFNYPEFSARKEIARHRMSTKTIWVGWVPVVLTPILSVSVGADGSVSVDVTATATQHASLTAGLVYNGSWSPVATFSNTFTFPPPDVFLDVKVKGWVGPRLEVLLYGVVGPYLEVRAYLRLDADTTACPWWKLYAGLEVPAGVYCRIFGKTIVDYHRTVLSYERELARAQEPKGWTTRVSIATGGAQGTTAAGYPAISGDGRYVLFDSESTNLVAGDANGFRDVFLHDRQTGQTTRVSVNHYGVEGNGASMKGDITPDGRYIVFQSTVNDWYEDDYYFDYNGTWDIFRLDRQAPPETMSVWRWTHGPDGIGPNGASESPVISADGQVFAFQSSASNLLGIHDDTNNVVDVYVWLFSSERFLRVSLASDGTQGDRQSTQPAISANGRYVVYQSDATNLVAGDTNAVADIFIHDLQTRQTARVSVTSGGAQVNGTSAAPDVSYDGRYVVFESGANNLVTGDTNGVTDIFVHDNVTGATARVSVSSTGGQADGASRGPAVTPDGRYVAFQSAASNLVAGDTNGVEDIFIRDLVTGQTTRVSVSSNDVEGNGYSRAPDLSTDSRYLVFQSAANNLVTGDTNAALDIFVRDRSACALMASVVPLR